MITRPGIDFADARNWPPMGNKSLSGYQKKRCSTTRETAGFATRPATAGLDPRRPRHRRRGLRQRRPARHVRLQRQRRALPLPQRSARRRRWVQFHLEGTKSNRDAVGAQLRCRRRTGSNSASSMAATASPPRAAAGPFRPGRRGRSSPLEIRGRPAPVRRSRSCPSTIRSTESSKGETKLRPLFPEAKKLMKTKLIRRRILSSYCLAAAARPALWGNAGGPPGRARKGASARAGRPAAGSEYRRQSSRLKEYDRCIAFFEKLSGSSGCVQRLPQLRLRLRRQDPGCRLDHPGDPRQQALNRTSPSRSSCAPSWIASTPAGTATSTGRRSSGGRTLGVADLEKAVEIAARGEADQASTSGLHRPGRRLLEDGRPEKARAIWQEGLKRFPGRPAAEARLSREGEELEAYIDDQLDPNKRVDTDLLELWEE
jgi:hypothetical protein